MNMDGEGGRHLRMGQIWMLERNVHMGMANIMSATAGSTLETFIDNRFDSITIMPLGKFQLFANFSDSNLARSRIISFMRNIQNLIIWRHSSKLCPTVKNSTLPNGVIATLRFIRIGWRHVGPIGTAIWPFGTNLCPNAQTWGFFLIAQSSFLFKWMHVHSIHYHNYFIHIPVTQVWQHRCCTFRKNSIDMWQFMRRISYLFEAFWSNWCIILRCHHYFCIFTCTILMWQAKVFRCLLHLLPRISVGGRCPANLVLFR